MTPPSHDFDFDSIPVLNSSESLQGGKNEEESFSNFRPMFMYNGHVWDAFEVLGVPPGSSVELIKEAFDASIKKSDQGTHEFLKEALTAILTEMKSRGYRP